jgi:hypothetical protein
MALPYGSNAVPTRPVDFAERFDDLPRHFAIDGDIVMSHILAVLSSVFPDGEDYFVRAVERVRDRVTDPKLRVDVEGFVGQESMHGREHRLLNDRLAELGYPTRAIGAYVRWLFRSRERIAKPRLHLAFTAALEHYTATLAETLLRSSEARAEVAHPAVQSLLMWHALEESEHKAVAFDVYRHVGGTDAARHHVDHARRVRVGNGHVDRDLPRPRRGRVAPSCPADAQLVATASFAVHLEASGTAAPAVHRARVPPERSGHDRAHCRVAHRPLRVEWRTDAPAGELKWRH